MAICRPGLLVMLPLLFACQQMPGKGDPVQAKPFSLSHVVKADIDLVAEVSVRQSRGYLQTLARKLYLRNPRQLRRSELPDMSVGSAVERVFSDHSAPPQLQGRRSAQAITLAFDPDFAGDRVAALVYGLRSMSADAYGGEGEFFLSDQFDPQRIYHLARNMEVAAWRLRTASDEQGRPLLLSSVDSDGQVNLSFERLFGKLIAVNDHFAVVIADSTNRQLKNVIQGFASMVFFPI